MEGPTQELDGAISAARLVLSESSGDRRLERACTSLTRRGHSDVASCSECHNLRKELIRQREISMQLQFKVFYCMLDVDIATDGPLSLFVRRSTELKTESLLGAHSCLDLIISSRSLINSGMHRGSPRKNDDAVMQSRLERCHVWASCAAFPRMLTL
jgi:hypothetical protein